jgi:hypothetical protein
LARMVTVMVQSWAVPKVQCLRISRCPQKTMPVCECKRMMPLAVWAGEILGGSSFANESLPASSNLGTAIQHLPSTWKVAKVSEESNKDRTARDCCVWRSHWEERILGPGIMSPEQGASPNVRNQSPSESRSMTGAYA